MKIKNILIVLGLFVSIFITLRFVFVIPYQIDGDCMEPAFKSGKTYFLNRITGYIREYKNNDVILYKYEDKIWISRIVALENETIQLSNGNIILNGVAALDKGIKRDWTNWKYGKYAIEEALKIPKDYVYVLSDKLSAHHDDSRVFGSIAKSSILGTIW